MKPLKFKDKFTFQNSLNKIHFPKFTFQNSQKLEYYLIIDKLTLELSRSMYRIVT